MCFFARVGREGTNAPPPGVTARRLMVGILRPESGLAFCRIDEPLPRDTRIPLLTELSIARDFPRRTFEVLDVGTRVTGVRTKPGPEVYFTRGFEPPARFALDLLEEFPLAADEPLRPLVDFFGVTMVRLPLFTLLREPDELDLTALEDEPRDFLEPEELETLDFEPDRTVPRTLDEPRPDVLVEDFTFDLADELDERLALDRPGELEPDRALGRDEEEPRRTLDPDEEELLALDRDPDEEERRALEPEDERLLLLDPEELAFCFPEVDRLLLGRLPSGPA